MDIESLRRLSRQNRLLNDRVAAGCDIIIHMSAAPNWVPVDEYLYNTYHPDCDYVDGVLVERNVGEIPHAKVQRRVLIYFYQRERQSNNFALQECRVQVSPTRYRVPDVCVTIDPSLTETSSPSHLFYALRFCHRRTA